MLHARDRRGIGVVAGHRPAAAEQIDKVAALSTARVEHTHAGPDPAPQKLIEEVDVDLAELRVEVHVRKAGPGHRPRSRAQDQRPESLWPSRRTGRPRAACDSWR